MIDPSYFLIVGPFVLLSLVASWFVRSRFSRWSRYGMRQGLTGAQVAFEVLRHAGVRGVEVEPVDGMLSDHYDPTHRTVRLSKDVYYSQSIAACAVAAHEVGHAVQHARGYAPLHLRTLAVPAATIGSQFSMLLFVAGLILMLKPLILVGVILFGAVVLFQLITLPVEFDASRRAKRILRESGLLVDEAEARGVSAVLSAAAMTYVAAALTSLATLFYYLRFLGGGRSDE